MAHLGRVVETVYNGRTKVATVAAGMLALMVGYHVVFGQNGLTAYQAKRHDARDLQVQVQELKRDNDRLKAHVDRLTNDPDKTIALPVAATTRPFGLIIR